MRRRMRDLSVHPDCFGFPLIIRACAARGDTRLCRAAHCHVIQLGLSFNIHVSNELMLMYSMIECVEVALRVFDRMPLRSSVSWNIMMSAFGRNCDCDAAIEMLHRMENEGVVPNSVTWTSFISGFARCGLNDKAWKFYALMRKRGAHGTAELAAVVASVCCEIPSKGALVHVHVIKAGFEEYVFVTNALVTMYGRNGDVGKAEYLFSGLKTRTLISWNALISVYAHSGLCDEALSSLVALRNSGSNIRPDVVSWSAVINGFSTSGRHEETLTLFRLMQCAHVIGNVVTVASVLSACAELSGLPLGKEIHSHSIRMMMDGNVLVKNALINMYMKCGSLTAGQCLFEKMALRHISSWNIMITGYGMHGLGEKALGIFHEMVDEGTRPDEVTFLAAISACSHSGLVSEGQEVFKKMRQSFQVVPRIEHYACMVDLFGRAGFLRKASMILESMPMEPNAVVWGALLNSCRTHGDTHVAEATASRIFKVDSGATTGSYMSLSNLYAVNGRWEESAKVRLSARTRGLKKLRGESWIVVRKKVHSFSAGDVFDKEEIEELESVLKALCRHSSMENQVEVDALQHQQHVTDKIHLH